LNSLFGVAFHIEKLLLLVSHSKTQPHMTQNRICLVQLWSKKWSSVHVPKQKQYNMNKTNIQGIGVTVSEVVEEKP